MPEYVYSLDMSRFTVKHLLLIERSAREPAHSTELMVALLSDLSGIDVETMPVHEYTLLTKEACEQIAAYLEAQNNGQRRLSVSEIFRVSVTSKE